MKRTRFLLLPALALLLLLVGLLGLSSQRLGLVHASSTTVIVTNCHDSGPGSLRDAIASVPAGSTITFSLSCDIKLKSTLVISKTLTLDGRGHQVTLDGQHTVQVLRVTSGVTFTLNTLTVANGFADRGGGIANLGTLSISNSTFAKNSASNGGGIDNDLGGRVSISNSTVSGNSASFDGGGIDNFGTLSISNSTVSGNSSDGIGNAGTMRITNSTVSGNVDGILNGFESGKRGMLSISNSTVSGNSRSGITNSGTMRITNSTVSGTSFAGILNIGKGNSSPGGMLSITNSTVSGNEQGIANGGTVSITNSTVSDNVEGIFSIVGGGRMRITNSTVSGNSGDGVFTGSETVSITNSTISGNSSDGIFYGGGGVLSIGGSIVANNMESNCAGTALTDQGYNLSNDSSCNFTASTSLQNTDPKLDPAGLQNNGGPTKTIALQPDSPAVDKIPVGSHFPATDQRGVPRPQGPKCDIGAFEMTAADGVRVMIHVVESFHLAKGLQTSLDQQLQAVLADLRAHQIAQACRDLTSFSNHVTAQSGKGLTSTQATQLLTEAAVIHTRLGC